MKSMVVTTLMNQQKVLVGTGFRDEMVVVGTRYNTKGY